MAAAGKTEEERRLAEGGEQVEPVPAPMSPACGTFLQFVGTVNTLWGSDRVLRMGQFLGRYVHGAPEFGPEAQALGAIFGAAFSQARYINRIYGIPDGIEGLMCDVPKAPAKVKLLKLVLHCVGAIGYHALEHLALVLMIIRRCDAAKIPRVKAWLEARGLWDRADDFDAVAQWCWFVEAAVKGYFAMITRNKINAALRKAVATGNNAAVPQLLNHRTMVQCDLIKFVTDLFLAAHYGGMVGGRPGLMSLRKVGLLGFAGSAAQFVVRYKQQVDKAYSHDMGLRM